MERPRATGLIHIASRIPGFSEAEMEGHRAIFAKREILPDERPKTPEEEQLISDICLLMKEDIEKYGGEHLPLTPGHFAILASDKEAVKKSKGLDMNGAFVKENSRSRAGSYNSKGFAKIFDDRIRNPADLARVITHEAFHFQSYQSFVFKDKKIHSLRIGLMLHNLSRKSKFDAMNEAMTEELTKRFLRKYGETLPHVKEYFKYLPTIKDKFEPQITDDLAFPTTTNREEKIVFDGGAFPFGYREVRELLWRTIDGIVEKSEGKIGREEVFEVFARAYFTKDMSQASKLVNDTYGPGRMKSLLNNEPLPAIKMPV